MKNKLKLITAYFLALALFVTSCEDDFTSPQSPEGTSITSLISSSADHDVLEAALVKTGLSAIYSNNNAGTFTVLAPNDAAFLSLLQTVYAAATPPTNEAEAIAKIEALTNTSTPLNLGTLASRLNYHVISSELKSSQITGGQTLATVNGARVSFSLVNNEVLLNGNLSGGGKVVAADIDAANGVIHSIDKVMPVPSTTTTVLTPFGLSVSYTTATPQVTGGSETAGDATGTDFDILAYAIRKANLATSLSPNPALGVLPEFTIFAPTDNSMRAFLGDTAPASASLENAAIQTLKAMDVSALADLLKYHVLSGRTLSTDLSNGKVLSTLLTGKSITVAISADAIPVVSLQDLNAATDPVVTSTNNINNNGVVHTINAVLRSN